jgi:hypothetical protein
MKLGAEPKKVAVLAGLLAVAGYLYFSGAVSEEPPRQTPRAPAPLAPPATPAEIGRPKPASRLETRAAVGREFRPSLKRSRAEDRPDPMTVDPTLRLELLARLQTLEADRARRSLFDFSAPPPPPLKTPEPKVIPKPAEEVDNAVGESKPPASEAKPDKPPPPPIPLKFYGFISPVETPGKRAFFLDGEDIFVAGEGELIRKRYKVVRIGTNSAVVEDTEHNHRQTLPLVEQKGQG